MCQWFQLWSLWTFLVGSPVFLWQTPTIVGFCHFEHFLYYQLLQAHLIYILPQPQNTDLPFIILLNLLYSVILCVCIYRCVIKTTGWMTSTYPYRFNLNCFSLIQCPGRPTRTDWKRYPCPLFYHWTLTMRHSSRTQKGVPVVSLHIYFSILSLQWVLLRYTPWLVEGLNSQKGSPFHQGFFIFGTLPPNSS